ncbi:MAG: hemolysin family protein [Candidatus Phosphoribacter sp.]
MDIVIGIAVVVLLTVATGYFVAQEFTYVAVDRGRLRALADAGDQRAARALRVTERLSFMLSGAQLGITVTGLLVGYAAEPLIGRGLADVLGITGLPYAARLSISLALVLLFSTGIQMVIGELAPKNLAIARSVPLARALARSTLIYLMIAGPLIRLFDSSATRLLRAVGIEPVEELSHGASADDLDRIIELSSAAGALDVDMHALLDRALAFPTRTVAQVMTPWVVVDVVTPESTGAELGSMAQQSGHARFPVVDRDDYLHGIVAVTDLLELRRESRSTAAVAGLARPAVVIPEVVPLARALEILREARSQVAVVVDEYGGLAGLITFEDIAEELVGEILDEDDLPDVQPTQDSGGWLVPGRTRVDDVAELAGVRLDVAGHDTMSGLVMALLSRVAVPGDVVRLPVLHGDVEADEPARMAGAVGPAGAAGPVRALIVRVEAVERHVPALLRIDTSTEVTA